MTTFDELWPALLRGVYCAGPGGLELELGRVRSSARLPPTWANLLFNAALLLVHLRARLRAYPDPAETSPRIKRRIELCASGWVARTGDLVDREQLLEDQPWAFEEEVLREGLLRRDVRGLVLQYLRLRTSLYVQLVHDPVDVGLGAYRGCYDRAQPLRNWPGFHHVRGGEPLALWLVERAGSEREVDVKGVEVRLGITQAIKLAGQLDARRATVGTEVGVVGTFIRRRGSDLETSLEDCARAHRRPLHRLIETLVSTPDTRLVGLDVAGDEMGEPCWVVAPVIEEIRAEVHAEVGRRVPLTVHLSETFRGPISGLRQLAEPLAYGMLERHDRVGHGIVAGLDLSALARRQSTVLQPRIERIWDLAFLIWARTRWPRVGGLDEPGALAEAYTEEVEKLSLAEFGHTLTAVELCSTWESLADRSRWVSFLAAGAVTPDLVFFQRVLRCHDGDPVRVQVPIREREIRLLPWIQSRVLMEYAALRVTIEINPTSNLLTQGFDVPVAQPGFHPKGYERVTISTDCPRAFAASLSDELLVARAGLHLAGVAADEAETWIKGAVERSWTSRFSRATHRIRLVS
ncbi:MAG: hypothetical protein V4850_23095 [Myxococcota bacterium]